MEKDIEKDGKTSNKQSESQAKSIDKDTNKKLSRLIYLTNKGMNFSISAMVNAIYEAFNTKNRLENLYRFLCKNNAKKIKKLPLSVSLRPGDTLAQLVSQANIINVQKNIKSFDFSVYSLKEVIRLSLSSSANYLEHISSSENISESIYSLIFDILDTLGKDSATINECKKIALSAGELQTQVLELLISTYEKKYGFIERVKVTTDFKKGSAILVVGEDFDFLHILLKETADKPISIYTYGILNYAHVFPEINKYKNLTGIYLGKYNNLSSDIENFPGVVVLTSGNLEALREIFRGRIFATEDISMLGVSKINKDNLKPLINAAYDAPGFSNNVQNCYIKLGYGLDALEEKSQELYNMMKSKKVQNIAVFLGCTDFNFNKRNFNIYKIIPPLSAIITLDCISPILNSNKKKIPFIIDFGQFVSFYSLIRLLYSVSGKFRKDINEMPINIYINLRMPDSVAALFTLLSLGIKNIKLTSDLPKYLTDSIISNFSTDFGIQKFIPNNNSDNLKKCKNM